MTTFGCVISAAGRGERLGANEPKALLTVGGVTMLTHAVRGIAQDPRISAIVVAAPADCLDQARMAVAAAGVRATVVAGGDTRTESVRRGVGALPPDLDAVLVHDAARPLTPASVIDSVIGAINSGAEAVVPGIPVADTIKQIGVGGLVVATPDRSTLRAIQTPQGFRADVLLEALRLSGADATDDAGLVERLGVAVQVVPGHTDALKITTPDDLALAETILRRRAGDVH